jgi:hypothetical protein
MHLKFPKYALKHTKSTKICTYNISNFVNICRFSFSRAKILIPILYLLKIQAMLLSDYIIFLISIWMLNFF